MPYQPCPGICQVEFVYDQFDQTVENIIHVSRDLSGEIEWIDTELEELSIALALWWSDNVQMLQPDSVTLREIVCTDLSSETGPQWTQPIADNGSSIQVGLPTGSTLCLSFKTALRGRSYRGRNYYIGLTETQVTGNEVTAGLLPVLAASWATIPQYLETELFFTAIWVVLSRVHNGAERINGIGTPVEVVSIVDDKVDSQRRRLSGRGE